MQTKEHDLHGILHSAKLVEEILRQEMAPLNIHPRQAHALMAIYHMQPVSQAELAEEFGITSASMSTMTDRLLTAGLITRKTDPMTRRRNLLELTDAGRAKLDLIFAAWRRVDEILRDAMGPDDAQILFNLSRKLRDRLGGKAPGGSKT